jgi:hypothetical protein
VIDTGREFPLGSLCDSWRIDVPEITVELAVGDVLLIGNRTLTVIDIEGSEVHFRVDEERCPLPPDPHQAEARTFRLKAK